PLSVPACIALLFLVLCYGAHRALHPFPTRRSSDLPAQAMENAAKLMQAGAHIVKIEGSAWLAETISLLTERGIPVCAHMGLTPQDRKSTRLNSSHVKISYAVFSLTKKTQPSLDLRD